MTSPPRAFRSLVKHPQRLRTEKALEFFKGLWRLAAWSYGSRLPHRFITPIYTYFTSHRQNFWLEEACFVKNNKIVSMSWAFFTAHCVVDLWSSSIVVTSFYLSLVT